MKLAGMDRSRLRSPLAQRLIVAIILFSSAITLILTVIQLYGQYRNDVNDIETDLAQIERVHLKTLTQSLWATNSKDLALQLEGLGRYRILNTSPCMKARSCGRKRGNAPRTLLSNEAIR